MGLRGKPAQPRGICLLTDVELAGGIDYGSDSRDQRNSREVVEYRDVWEDGKWVQKRVRQDVQSIYNDPYRRR